MPQVPPATSILQRIAALPPTWRSLLVFLALCVLAGPLLGWLAGGVGGLLVVLYGLAVAGSFATAKGAGIVLLSIAGALVWSVILAIVALPMVTVSLVLVTALIGTLLSLLHLSELDLLLGKKLNIHQRYFHIPLSFLVGAAIYFFQARLFKESIFTPRLPDLSLAADSLAIFSSGIAAVVCNLFARHILSSPNEP